MRKVTFAVLSLVMLAGVGCGSDDVPQAHKGRLFNKTGALAFWQGGKGFEGPILEPGTYYTGYYNEVRMVDCSMTTVKEPLQALTKDGVQFGLDIYVRFSADCKEGTVTQLLTSISSEGAGKTITLKQLYETFVRPAIGEAVRETVSPNRANEINEKREEILAKIRKIFIERMKTAGTIDIKEVVLSNLVFPEAMNHANTDRAVQAVLKDKAIAEREKVQAEIQTAELSRQLAEKQGEVEAGRIDKIGAALKRNPDYLQYDMQSKMTKIYEEAGAKGNMVITAPNPSVLIAPKR